MRYLLIVFTLLFWQAAPAQAESRVSVNIGINMSSYPVLVPVPGYPVYYSPRADLNYFFYDGYYWVYLDDGWYSSAWYNGPWVLAEPLFVPVYVLRVPVRYYRRPPPYFHGWHADAPPHWGEYWGPSWEARRRGWDHWDHHYVPPPAPLPTYQQQYSGKRYPRELAQQQAIRAQNYHYQPRDGLTRKDPQQPNRLHLQPEAEQPAQTKYYVGGQRSADAERQPQPSPPPRQTQAAPQSNAPDGDATDSAPNNQGGYYYPGRRWYHRDRGETHIDRQDSGVGTPIPNANTPPPSQTNRFESGRDTGDRGSRQDRGGDSRGGGHGQGRR